MIKIMVVEADEDLSIEIMKLLKKQQYEILQLTDTPNLFSRVYHFRPDLFVLGYGHQDLLPELSAFDPTHHLPVICLNEGPLDKEKLLEDINELFHETPVEENDPVKLLEAGLRPSENKARHSNK